MTCFDLSCSDKVLSWKQYVNIKPEQVTANPEKQSGREREIVSSRAVSK